MSMKIYDSQLSPFAARVRLAIYAKGLDVEIVEAFGDPAIEEELGRANPMNKVPTLVRDGVAYPESETICEYLEDIGIGPSLRPDDPDGRARARLLSRIGDLYVMKPMTKLFGQINPQVRDQALVDRELADLAKGMNYLAFYLDGSAYAVGGKLSLADCTLAPILFFYEQVGPLFGFTEVFKDIPTVGSYFNGLKRDPHVARVLSEVQTALRKTTER